MFFNIMLIVCVIEGRVGFNMEGRERRFLEEEGLYVGEKPLVSMRNVNRMEQRILREEQAVRVPFFAAVVFVGFALTTELNAKLWAT